MSHTPFIVAAYTIALVLMGWCALAPIIQGRRLKRFILSRSTDWKDDDASNP